MRKKLLVYDYHQFGKLNSEILENDPRKVLTEVFNGLELLEKVQKRTTRTVIDLKRKKLMENGVDIDNLTYDLKEKYYKEVNLIEENP